MPESDLRPPFQPVLPENFGTRPSGRGGLSGMVRFPKQPHGSLDYGTSRELSALRQGGGASLPTKLDKGPIGRARGFIPRKA